MFSVNMISTSGLSKKIIVSKVSFRIGVLALTQTEMVILCVCLRVRERLRLTPCLTLCPKSTPQRGHP